MYSSNVLKKYNVARCSDMLSEMNIPEIKGGLSLVKKNLPNWRVVEKNNIISAYRDFPLNDKLFLIRLSIDGMTVFKKDGKLLSSKDFPCPSDSYVTENIGEVRIDGSFSFTDYAFEVLFTSNEKVFLECKRALLFLGRFYIMKLDLKNKIQ